MGSYWSFSRRLDALCADWENAEINILAGLEHPQRTHDLATRIQLQFLKDMKGDLNREFRARHPDPEDRP